VEPWNTTGVRSRTGVAYSLTNTSARHSPHDEERGGLRRRSPNRMPVVFHGSTEKSASGGASVPLDRGKARSPRARKSTLATPPSSSPLDPARIMPMRGVLRRTRHPEPERSVAAINRSREASNDLLNTFEQRDLWANWRASQARDLRSRAWQSFCDRYGFRRPRSRFTRPTEQATLASPIKGNATCRTQVEHRGSGRLACKRTTDV